MYIEHIAIWTKNLEKLKDFYQTYFQASSGDKYSNPNTGFESYFLSFSNGARLELMQMPSIPEAVSAPAAQFTGLIHIAISVGSKQLVDRLTARLRHNGFLILDGPRYTGDGYYESVVLDPDGNRVEITI